MRAFNVTVVIKVPVRLGDKDIWVNPGSMKVTHMDGGFNAMNVQWSSSTPSFKLLYFKLFLVSYSLKLIRVI